VDNANNTHIDNTNIDKNPEAMNKINEVLEDKENKSDLTSLNN